ncbi:MAG: hypothetical protein HZB34_13375 [Nitrospirae bacterium]|jgi:uncharacterized Zn finger protein|nr:hypothetical protein [Nitrospirota bacterium]
MTCMRCQGCMAKDHFMDLLESSEDMWLTGWRCLNCGHVFDPVMERNRLRQGRAAVVSTGRASGQDRIGIQEEGDVIPGLAA